MVSFQPMSESEMQVMRVLWDSDGAVTSAQVIKRLEQTKSWKPSTVWTFLGRLAEKGLIRAEKKGKRSLYTPVISEEQYRQIQTRQFLDNVHGGSISSFFAALSGGDQLDDAEFEELKRWLASGTDGER